MKFIVLFALVAVCIDEGISAIVQQQLVDSQGLYQPNLEQLRIRKSAKSAYGGASLAPAAPCGTNYLFSCGPQLQPVACSSGGGAASGLHGAYSEYIPQYINPQQYAAPQQFVAPPQYALPPYAVPVITEV